MIHGDVDINALANWRHNINAVDTYARISIEDHWLSIV